MKRLPVVVFVGQAVPDIRAPQGSRRFVRHSLTYGQRAARFPSFCQAQPDLRANRGYTLVEMLLSVTLTLILMAFVVQIFGMVGNSVQDSRALLEMNDRLRSTAERLRQDLDAATAEMTPARSPGEARGYFEIIEGPIGPVTSVETVAINTNDPSNPVADTTVIDNDDVLMLTVQSRDDPFVGRAFVKEFPSGKQVGIDAKGPFQIKRDVKSRFAEVFWFVRGTTLYRGRLLVSPEFDADTRPTAAGQEALTYDYLYNGPGSHLAYYSFSLKQPSHLAFYNNFDLSVRLEGYDTSNPADTTNWRWAPNTLADLAKPENRFAHQTAKFPFHPHTVTGWQYLGLPTLRECSWCVDATHAWWPGTPLPAISLSMRPDLEAPTGPLAAGQFDAWNHPLPYAQTDLDTGALDDSASSLDPHPYLGPRVAEDVILTNVVGFDVKVWDPGAPLLEYGGECLAPGDPGYDEAVTAGALNSAVGYGAYVDMGYNTYPTDPKAPTPRFAGDGNLALRRVYDTWSNHYERDGINQDNDGSTDEGANGFDDNGNGMVDDADEREAPPPYDAPLRAIQIRIRVIEPDTRQVREVTIVHDFLPR